MTSDSTGFSGVPASSDLEVRSLEAARRQSSYISTAMSSRGDVTALLLDWSRGDQSAFDRLVPLVYVELRRIAARQLRREREGHTLDTSALVHELYLRLVDQRRATWKDRAHFFALAAQLMRRTLVDHARARQASKRRGSAPMIELADAEDEAIGSSAEVLAVHEALERLAALDGEHARIVELRFFAGLTVEETAHVLSRSPRTIKRSWRLAKAWLYRELRR